MRFLVAILVTCLWSAPASATPDSDPVALITAIYQSYQADEPGLDGIYSERLQALLDKNAGETPEGEVGRIDWDVLIDGQDWRLSDLKIALVSQQLDHAQVRATFKNFERPSNMLFDLVLEDGHWRVDDVTKTLRPRWTMSKILSDTPDAFPDEESEESSDAE